MSTTPPAGWYPDPGDATQVRYWDGQQWTDQLAPANRQPQHQAAPTPTAAPDSDRAAAPRHAVSSGKVPLFGARKHARQTAENLDRANAEIARLRAEMDRLGALEVAELERQREALRAETQAMRENLAGERASLERALADLKTRVVKTQEAEILQEVGIYEYRHPLSDSVAYRAELENIKDQIKTMAKADGGAIQSATNWQVEGSAAKGRKLVRDISKLMLRAYNAEADNLVRGLKPYWVCPISVCGWARPGVCMSGRASSGLFLPRCAMVVENSAQLGVIRGVPTQKPVHAKEVGVHQKPRMPAHLGPHPSGDVVEESRRSQRGEVWIEHRGEVVEDELQPPVVGLVRRKSPSHNVEARGETDLHLCCRKHKRLGTDDVERGQCSHRAWRRVGQLDSEVRHPLPGVVS